MARKSRLGRIAGALIAAAASAAGDRARVRADGLRQQASHGGRFHCYGCDRDYRGIRALNAHHLARHASRWSSKAARTAGRRMGKETDNLRRHALGWLEASGLRAWKTVPVRDKDGKPVERNGRAVTREVPVRTDRARSRPEVRGTVTRGQLRLLHDHDRDHERAGRHDIKAGRHEERGRTGRASDHQAKAAALRDRWARRDYGPEGPAPDDDRVRELLGRAAADARARSPR